jgi:hypothetical protein
VSQRADDDVVKELLRQAKKIACEYYQRTRRPLGVTGEVAEYEASEKLKLTLEVARTKHFDASKLVDGQLVRFQIKGRAVASAKRPKGRVPSIKCDGDFEEVLLVLLDKSTLDAIEIWQATRESVKQRLDGLTGNAPRVRRSMNISQFVSIPGAKKVWTVTS